MPDAVFDDIWGRADPLAIRLLSGVRPLFRGRPTRRPEHIGTGVLLRVGLSRLILTAAHVMDEFSHGDILLSGNGALEGVRGQGVRIDPSAGKRRTEDIVDVGILRIDDDLPLSVDSDFLALTTIGIQEPHAPGNLYLALGYPLKMTKVFAEARRVVPRPIKYIGIPAAPTIYNSLGVHPSTHVVLDFDRERTVTETGTRRVIQPRGMSGGGVWWWANEADGKGPPEAYLTAILTEHRATQKALVATRIRYHIALIRRRWPDLAEHLAGFPTP